MARANRGGTVSLRNSEFVGGLLYLPFYLMLTALLLSALCKACGWEPDTYHFNLVVFVVNFLAIVGIFHRFLFTSLKIAGKNFWLFIQAVILATVFYFAVTYAMQWALGQFGLMPKNMNDDSVATLLKQNFSVMTICISILVPITEECLCRGLIFGTVYKKNRIVAYIVSMLVFALLHTWQYVLDYSFGSFIVTTLTYLPAGLALCWAYEKSGTIWAPILTHALVNFITAFVTVKI